MAAKTTVEGLAENLRRTILEENYGSLREAVEEQPVKFHDKLLERGLVYIHGERCYDNAMRQVGNQLELCRKVEDLEQTCQKFLVSLFSLGSEKLNNLTVKIRDKWRCSASKFGYSSFLSQETLRAEEIEFIKEKDIKFHPRQYNRQPVEKLREMKTSNECAQVLSNHYNEIVEIACFNDMINPFVEKLSEVRLIIPALKNQVEKMSNKVIQAKAIIGDIQTNMMRSMVPKKLFGSFIGVLRSFKCFQEVAEEMSKEANMKNWPDIYRAISPLPKMESAHSCMAKPTFQKIPNSQPEESIDHKFRNRLCEHYQARHAMNFPKNNNLLKHKIPWKFFDLATNELSLTTTKRSGGPLDLKLIPQKIYDNCPDRARTLIVGSPGVGKSSIIIEMCKQWSHDKLLLDYTYVIHLRAKYPNIKNAKSVSDLIQNKVLTPAAVENSGKKTLIIIDGYDELSEESREENSFYDLLIQGEDQELPEVSIIVTTRPWCMKNISGYFQEEVEILGFTCDGRDKYIEYLLDQDDAQKLKHSLHGPMLRCSTIPLYLFILVEIFNDYKQGNIAAAKPKALQAMASDPCDCKFPNTITLLYGALVRTLVLRYIKSDKSLSKFKLQSMTDISPGKFIDLPNQIYMHFLDVCAFSCAQLFDPTKRFPKPVTFDLLQEQTIMHTSGDTVFYTFLHSSIQEYVAAYYISRMDHENEREEWIKKLMQFSNQYYLVLEFLCGSDCIKLPRFREKLYRYNPIRNFNILRQICETSFAETIINSVYGKFEKGKPCVVERTWPLPSPVDLWCLGKVIALSGCVWELGFTLRPIRNEHLKMLCEGIESVDRPTGQIIIIKLMLNKIDEEGLSCLLKLHGKCLIGVKEIYLRGNCLTSLVIPVLCKELHRFALLKKFVFHHNEVEPGGHKELIQVMSTKCKQLEHVTFTDLQPDECHWLLSKTKIKVAEFWRISTDSCKATFENLPQSYIEQLEIYQTEINLECIRTLYQTLCESRVQVLKLVNCAINSYQMVEGIVEAVQKTPSMKCIDLSDNCIQDDGGTLLVDGLWTEFEIDLLKTSIGNKFSEEKANDVKSASYTEKFNDEPCQKIVKAGKGDRIQHHHKSSSKGYYGGDNNRGYHGERKDGSHQHHVPGTDKSHQNYKPRIRDRSQRQEGSHERISTSDKYNRGQHCRSNYDKEGRNHYGEFESKRQYHNDSNVRDKSHEDITSDYNSEKGHCENDETQHKEKGEKPSWRRRWQ